jgi:F5/8 type C domain
MKRTFTAGRSPGVLRTVVSIGALVAASGAVVALVVGGATAQAASTDLACGKPASASSNTSTAANADDCTPGTTWQSTTSKPQQWQVDLGTTTTVDHVTVTWGTGYGTSYKVRTSPDGSNWHTTVGNTAGRGGTETLTLPANTSTRWIQLYLSQYRGCRKFVRRGVPGIWLS